MTADIASAGKKIVLEVGKANHLEMLHNVIHHKPSVSK